MCAAIIKDEDKNLNLFRPIEIYNLKHYLISSAGLIYNTKTKKYLVPHKHINLHLYVSHLTDYEQKIISSSS